MNRIVVVEDDPAIRHGLEATLRSETYDVLTVKVAPTGVSPARRLVVDWRTDGPYARLTHDGRHLIRYSEEQRAFEQVEIGTGNVRRLASDGPNPAEVLVAGRAIELSTDGRRLAVIVRVRKPRPLAGRDIEFQRAELRVVDVGGGGPGRVLATWDSQSENRPQIDPFAWSPRNDRIWLWVIQSDQSVQIASVDMSGKLHVLKTLTWVGNTRRPSLSPDGRFLAYSDATDRQTPPDIYVIATDGSREQHFQHPANDSKPIFVPDGSGVVFESDRRGFRDLWFQAVADGRPAGQPRLVWRNVGPFGAVERFADSGTESYRESRRASELSQATCACS